MFEIIFLVVLNFDRRVICTVLNVYISNKLGFAFVSIFTENYFFISFSCFLLKTNLNLRVSESKQIFY